MRSRFKFWLTMAAGGLLCGCAYERSIENGPVGPEVNKVYVWPIKPPCRVEVSK